MRQLLLGLCSLLFLRLLLLSLLVGLGGLCAGLEKVKRFTILPVILMIRISCVVFVVTY